MKTIAVFASLVCLVSSALAQDLPVPKLLKGMQGDEKGRWQMEVLEGGGRARKGMTITLCTANLIDQARGGNKGKGESSCQHKLVKDTADEAVIESECKERKSTVSVKREGKSLLMTMDREGPDGPQSMKMRATRLGACREGNSGTER